MTCYTDHCNNCILLEWFGFGLETCVGKTGRGLFECIITYLFCVTDTNHQFSVSAIDLRIDISLRVIPRFKSRPGLGYSDRFLHHFLVSKGRS